METIDMRSFKEKLRDGYYIAKDFANRYPSETIILVTSSIGLITAGVKGINKIHTQRKERFHTEREIYDPLTGSYIRIKRRMDSNDHLAFERLVRQGVGRSEALNMLNLL